MNIYRDNLFGNNCLSVKKRNIILNIIKDKTSEIFCL